MPAFADALRMLNNRIPIFVSLPIRSLDQLTLRKQLDAMGTGRDRRGEGSALMKVGDGGVMKEAPAPLPTPALAEGLGTGASSRPWWAPASWRSDFRAAMEAIALLGNTISTGAILVVLITIFGPSPAHLFDPAVSLVFAARGDMRWREVIPYIAVQCAGGIARTVVAHLMFDLARIAMGIDREGASQLFAEAVATFSLILIIFGGMRYAPRRSRGSSD